MAALLSSLGSEGVTARIAERGRTPCRSAARASSPAPPGQGRGRSSVVHEMALVQDLGAGAHQRWQVLVGVVAAEEQLAPRGHGRANPRASAAHVAAIRRVQLRLVQCGAFKSPCVHVSITHHDRAPVHPCSPAAQSGYSPPNARCGGETRRRGQRPRAPKRRPPAQSGPGLVTRGKRPRTRATHAGGHKRGHGHL